ncbi:putative glutamate--cysteine ligase 2-3 [Kitasatospora sp. NE20-6]|uniref:carboxylate-amine ligase n=1 Tax=Kitasatospora sp. NE20-6 TaxID=2859066 RepID=UPI0034DC78C8
MTRPAGPAGGGITVPTVGVEEEFLLVDRRSRLPAGLAPVVVKAAADELGEQVQSEFFTSQAEVCTRPVLTLADLRGELVRLRATLHEAAADAGCRLVGTGMPVVTDGRPPGVTDTPRYREIGELVGAVAASPEGAVCGCHVHVGVECRATALALNNRLRPWLPVVQALAVNSPYSSGRDTGFASWRHAYYRRWPTVGPSPRLDEPAYRATVARLLDSGVILDPAMIYWYSRPSEHVPTLETRVTDSNADVDTTVLVAALLRGLAATLLAEPADAAAQDSDGHGGGRTELLEAHWSAAVHGLGATAHDPGTGRILPMDALVDRLVERARPGLEAAGDLATVRRLLAALRAAGTGADRQRAAFARHGRFHDVVDELAAVTAAG